MSVPTKYGSPARRRLMPLAATAFAVLSLLGSAGLAQSMFGDTATTSGPKPKLKRVERPKLSSFEYRLSWGLQSIEADRAYARGITGAGVTVAMIDTGVASQRNSGLGSLSPLSTDLIANRKPPATISAWLNRASAA